MLDARLKVIAASDDPGMFPTTLAEEYRILADDLCTPYSRLRQMALAGVDACWLPGPERAALRERFERELGVLDAEIEAAG